MADPYLLAASRRAGALLLPTHVAVCDAGQTGLVADAGDYTVKAVWATGGVGVVAGSGRPGYSDGAGARASFVWIRALSVHSDGRTVGVIDEYRVRLLCIRTGLVTTIAGQGTFGYVDGVGCRAAFDCPWALAATGDGFAVVEGNLGAVRLVFLASGRTTTLCGGKARYRSVDGRGAAAAMVHPGGAAACPGGRLLVTERGTGVLRTVGPLGDVTTVTGGDFHRPTTVAVDVAGRVVVGDTGQEGLRLRVLEPGRPLRGLLLSGDAVRLDRTSRVALGADGHLWAVDTGRGVFRIPPSATGLRACYCPWRTTTWTPRLHWDRERCSAEARCVVQTVLLLEERLDRHPGPLPLLPVELWLEILRFCPVWELGRAQPFAGM